MRQIALLVAALLVWSVNAQDSETLVAVSSGLLRGEVVNDHLRRFLGIPYGASTGGENRWRPPQPAGNWTGERNATVFGDDCVQGSNPIWFVPTSEDCLHLNVYAPLASSNYTDMAVMVYIHGGANTNGGTSVPTYNPNGMIDIARDIVVVTLNYRLGVLGFLGGYQMAEEREDGGSGNFAFLDQRLALEWVRDNIAVFGGSPDRVTIFGESAGSLDVGTQLVLERSAGLFRAAIMESGCANRASVTMGEAEEHFQLLASYFNCSTLSCLRNIRPRRIMDAAVEVGLSNVDYVVTIDNVECFGDPGELMQAGNFTKVPMIVGSNQDEVPGFAPLNVTDADYQAGVMDYFGDFGADILAVYPSSDYETPWFALQQLITDYVFTCPVRRDILYMAPFTDIYAYYMSYTLGYIEEYAPEIGAYHASELKYVFNTPVVFSVEDDYEMARIMVTYWTSFAKSHGNPNADDVEPWPTHDGTYDGAVQEINVPTKTIYSLKVDQCNMWDTMPYELDHRALLSY